MLGYDSHTSVLCICMYIVTLHDFVSLIGFGGSLNSELARIESEVVNVLGTLDALPEGEL